MSTLEDVFINLSKIIKQKNKNKDKLKEEEIKFQNKRDINNKILHDENNYHIKYNFFTKILTDGKVSFNLFKY